MRLLELPPKEELLKAFSIDQNSASGLIWLMDSNCRNPEGRRYKGDVAGRIRKSKNGEYWEVGFSGKTYQVHRLILHILGFDLTGKIVDHLDGCGLNNNIDNLRVCDFQTNLRNRKMPKNNSTGFCGVSIHRRNGEDLAYRAQWVENKKIKYKYFSIRKNGKTGAFDLAVEFRKNKIKERKPNEAAYSERHGTN